ncbi:hypothetical protein BJQ58_14600 [Klebsiella pneumoniae]|nr:hypothetical protein [Klebsiella pneumoniae]HBY9424798.1 hypothetical protein [Klebsiella pneumoniae]
MRCTTKQTTRCCSHALAACRSVGGMLALFSRRCGWSPGVSLYKRQRRGVASSVMDENDKDNDYDYQYNYEEL